MPSKKTKKIKSKSKRYSCELCSDIDNALMILCDECQSKYHTKCIGVIKFDEDDKWLCSDCRKLKLSRTTKSSKDTSKFEVNNSKPNVQNGQQPNVKDARTNENQNQDKASLRTSRQSQGMRSSTKRRTEIELERLEEERKLKEIRDKEYLDSKYKILLDGCSNRSECSRSERHSTDRSSFTRQWVQSTEVPDASQVPPKNQRATENMNNEGSQRFQRRIDNITFDNTSLDPDKVKAVRELSQRLNREYQNELAALYGKQKVEQQPNPIPSERQRNQQPSTSKIPTQLEGNNQSNRERIPCSVHDARRVMFQDRGTSKQNGNIGMPCSNSTFAAPNTNVVDNRDNNRRTNTTFNTEFMDYRDNDQHNMEKCQQAVCLKCDWTA